MHQFSHIVANLIRDAPQIFYALNVLPDLSGIFLSLVTVAPNEGSVGHSYRFKVDTAEMNAPSVQVTFVFYDKANLEDFQRRARSAWGIEDWEKGNLHFVVSDIGCIQATENV